MADFSWEPSFNVFQKTYWKKETSGEPEVHRGKGKTSALQRCSLKCKHQENIQIERGMGSVRARLSFNFKGSQICLFYKLVATKTQ